MKTTATITALSFLLFGLAACNAQKDDAKTPPAAPEQVNADGANADNAKAADAANAADAKAADAPKADDAKAADAPKADDAKGAEVPEVTAPDAPTAAPQAAKTAPLRGSVSGEKFLQLDFKPVIEGTVCENPEGCDYAEERKCPMNGTVTADGQCYCGTTLVRDYFEGYICMEIAKGVYDLGCTEPDGCPCRGGKTKTYANMGCDGYYATCGGAIVPGRGLSCNRKPYQNMYYSLRCFNDECGCYGETIHKGDTCPPLACERGYSPSPNGCACNGKLDDGVSECVVGKEAKIVVLCKNPDGCECGEGVCPAGTVCRHNKCVDRIAFKEIPEGYEMHFGVPRCAQEDSCACGKKGKCANGKYCVNGTCYGDPYTRKIGGKTYYYHIFSKEIADAGDKEKYRNDLWALMFVDMTLPSEGNPGRPICSMFSSVREKGSAEDLCKSADHSGITIEDILTHCGTKEIPDNVANMYCTLDVVDGALEFSGWENE